MCRSSKKCSNWCTTVSASPPVGAGAQPPTGDPCCPRRVPRADGGESASGMEPSMAASAILILLTTLTTALTTAADETSMRQERIFNPIQVINFPNLECESDDGTKGWREPLPPRFWWPTAAV